MMMLSGLGVAAVAMPMAQGRALPTTPQAPAVPAPQAPQNYVFVDEFDGPAGSAPSAKWTVAKARETIKDPTYWEQPGRIGQYRNDRKNVFLDGKSNLVIRAAKRFGFIDRITPAGRTLGRREAFPDLEEARAYFSGKALFRRFDPDCLEAYVRHGLADSGGGSGLRLRFDPATEISIYRSVPHSSPGRPRQLQVPLAMVRGRHSKVVLPHHTRLIRAMPRNSR